MNTNSDSDSLTRQYQQLVASLADTGYISQGSVLDPPLCDRPARATSGPESWPARP